jgi:DNA-binding GntR family transcriptional regulator
MVIVTIAPPRGQVAYERIKSNIFDFRLLPGDRFSEPEIAERFGMSRTPVREALLRLEREGYVTVEQRSGWQVRPLDLKAFDEFYDVRLILESAAIRRVCELDPQPPLTSLRETWFAPRSQWFNDPRTVSELDEGFHATLVAAAGKGFRACMEKSPSASGSYAGSISSTRSEFVRCTRNTRRYSVTFSDGRPILRCCCCARTSRPARPKCARSPCTCSTKRAMDSRRRSPKAAKVQVSASGVTPGQRDERRNPDQALASSVQT